MFLRASHALNRLKLAWLVAIVRVILHMLLAPLAKEEQYAKPKRTGGYRGWVEVPFLGALAFRKLDGKLQYRW